jgi:hypothetical protein
MVPISVFDYLITQKTNDAIVLLKNRRHVSAVYLMGYALEYTLKKKICATLMFSSGFPEKKHELVAYITALNANPAIATNPITFTDIKEIKNHNLNKLLIYSGAEPRIKRNYLAEWSHVASWNPENRYQRQRISNVKATLFIASSRKLMKQII